MASSQVMTSLFALFRRAFRSLNRETSVREAQKQGLRFQSVHSSHWVLFALHIAT